MINTTSCRDREVGGAAWRMAWEQTCIETVDHLILEMLDRLIANLEAYAQNGPDGRLLWGSLEDVRQLRGAMSMMAFEQGARLLAAAEELIHAALDDRGAAPGAPRALRSALSALRARLVPEVGAGTTPDLAYATEALRSCLIPGNAAPGAGVSSRDPAGDDDAEAEAHYVGEWMPGAQVEPDDRRAATPETGRCIAQIKANLKTVADVMPRWWEDLRDERCLETLNRSFAVIAEHAETLHLAEIAKLAELLERLVAKVNDEMISSTLQMMYGVIEQGVLKLGILFLQYCRPQGAPDDSAARQQLEKALAGMRLLSSRVGATMPEDGLRARAGAVPPARQLTLDGASAERPGEWAVDAYGHRRLEDLFVEANLLHSQLMPRMQMMRQQQRELQRELAGLQGLTDTEVTTSDGEWTWHTDESPELSEKVASMRNANRLLAKLITECEACLQNYRRATHELQGTILGGLSEALSHPPFSAP